MSNAVPETGQQAIVNDTRLGDTVPLHPPDPLSSGAEKLLAPATAGQQAAGAVLREAIREQHPIVLLFGETGVGKSTLIQSILANTDVQHAVTAYVSATGGEFVGPPTFDALLNAIFQRVTDGERIRERPAVLAELTSAVAAFARAGRTVVLAIDHADHLTDKVISELIKLPEYLNADPAGLVRIFVGSATLASRLDAALRRPGAVGRRFVEIRLPQPTAEEVATLLAYEDMAQPGGPMLNAGAIDRISAYAKSNLHWAVPLADAARALALYQGEREVTPELVGGALLELWPPGQQAGLVSDPGSAPTLQGLSDVETAGFADLAAGPGQGSWPATPRFEPAGAAKTTKPWLLRWLWIAAAALVLAVAIGLLGFLLGNDRGKTTLTEQPKVATEGIPTPQPGPPSPSEPSSRAGEGSGPQPPAPEVPPASVPEPPANSRAEERPAPAPAPTESATKAPVITSPASPASKVPATNKPAVKSAAKPKAAKKTEERPEHQWIQRR